MYACEAQGVPRCYTHPAFDLNQLQSSSASPGVALVASRQTKARGHFPNDEAAFKLLYLAIRNMEKKWNRQPQNRALNQFSIMFAGRLPA